MRSQPLQRFAIPSQAPPRFTFNIWRDPLAGMLIIIGLCWPYLFSSVLHIPWWFFIPFALLGGFLRQRDYPHDTTRYIPIWAFGIVMLIYTLLAYSFRPMPNYGTEKVLHFWVLGGAAYIATHRQTPLTEGLLRGMRWAMALTLLLGVVITLINRQLFLNVEQYGMEEMRQLFSVTGFPLTLAIASLWVIPRTIKPLPVFGAGLLLLLCAVLEIFVRGRFAAVTLGAIAALLIIGPPVKYWFSRLLLAGLLLCGVVGVFIYVLPNFGDSYAYLQLMINDPFTSREGLIHEAWRGFMAHPLGQGIGAFSEGGMMDNYPHNALLEAAYELGLPGLLCLAVIYVYAMRRAWQLWLSPPHRVFAAILIVVFAYTMKAGDLATWALQWVYLYMLLVATPVAASWPLVHGEHAT